MISEETRTRFRLNRRRAVTDAWVIYDPETRLVVEALHVWYERRWTARSLAEYIGLSPTTVRRRLAFMVHNGIVDHTREGYRITDHGRLLNEWYERIVWDYIKGGIPFNREFLEAISANPDFPKMNSEKLRNHIWLPVLTDNPR